MAAKPGIKGVRVTASCLHEPLEHAYDATRVYPGCNEVSHGGRIRLALVVAAVPGEQYLSADVDRQLGNR